MTKLQTVLCGLCLVLPMAWAGMLGGWKLQPIELLRDTLFKESLDEMVHQYNARLNTNTYYVPYQIHEFHTQVVAGFNYKIDMTVVPSGCTKQNAKKSSTLKQCGLGKTGNAQRIKVSIWMTPGSNFQNFQLHKVLSPVEPRLHDQLFIVGIDDFKDAEYHGEFDAFMKRFNKQYKNKAEKDKRRLNFIHNSKVVQLLQLVEQGSGQYGLTQFADMTEREFRQTHLSPEWDLNKMPKKRATLIREEAPDSVDWRKKGAVTEVKNQGSCGSCWAFSTTGNIEGQWFLKKGKLVSLSEQQLVDCDKVDHGCQGGLPIQAYKVIMQMGGLETEKDYPYDGHNDKCSFVKSETAAHINGSLSLSKDEGQMAAWTAQNGPISIGINAFAMQFYFGGVSHPWSIFCSKTHLDHGVLIVGYGKSSSGEPYWIVKNSWGPSWGEQGYYLVYRGDGTCGLNQMPTSATVA